MSEELYAALHRITRAPVERVGDLVTTALREASAMAGARVAVLRLPDGSGGVTEFRVPQGSTWPSRKLVNQWHTRVLRTARPLALKTARVPRRRREATGVAFPVFTADGAAGSMVALSTARHAFTLEECAILSLFAQTALARIEAIRSREQAGEVAAAEIHRRVAQALHDGPLQVLTGMLFRLRTSGATGRRDPHRTLGALAGELRRAVSETRALIRRLRVPLRGTVLEGRVREALTRLQELSGVSCALRWKVTENLISSVVAEEVSHVVNEALANVYRHAKASHVTVFAQTRGHTFEMTIRDDGIGFDVARALRRDIRKRSFGLVSMHERIARVNGTLELRSQAGEGTRVRLAVPLGRGTSRRRT